MAEPDELSSSLFSQPMQPPLSLEMLSPSFSQETVLPPFSQEMFPSSYSLEMLSPSFPLDMLPPPLPHEMPPLELEMLPPPPELEMPPPPLPIPVQLLKLEAEDIQFVASWPLNVPTEAVPDVAIATLFEPKDTHEEYILVSTAPCATAADIMEVFGNMHLYKARVNKHPFTFSGGTYEKWRRSSVPYYSGTAKVDPFSKRAEVRLLYENRGIARNFPIMKVARSISAAAELDYEYKLLLGLQKHAWAVRIDPTALVDGHGQIVGYRMEMMCCCAFRRDVPIEIDYISPSRRQAISAISIDLVNNKISHLNLCNGAFMIGQKGELRLVQWGCASMARPDGSMNAARLQFLDACANRRKLLLCMQRRGWGPEACLTHWEGATAWAEPMNVGE